MNNPYKPPEARVADKPSQVHGATWKSVGLGLLTDVGSTIVFGQIVGLVFIAQGLGQEDFVRIANSTGFQLFGLLTGSSFTILGGYVAARVANHAEYRHGFYLGLASLIFGELFNLLGKGEQELWLHLAGLILIFPAALYGAHWRLKQKHIVQ